MYELQALQAGTVRSPEAKSAASEGPDGEVRGSRGSLIRMHDMDPPVKGHYTKLRTTHHRMLLRILGAWCKSPNKRILSYKDALQRTECESIETTMRTRRLWSGALLRMGDHRLREGGYRFMAAWVKTEENASEHRQRSGRGGLG